MEDEVPKNNPEVLGDEEGLEEKSEMPRGLPRLLSHPLVEELERGTSKLSIGSGERIEDSAPRIFKIFCTTWKKFIKTPI